MMYDDSDIYISLDADYQGELMVVIRNYHDLLTQKAVSGELSVEESLEKVYKLGCIECRMFYDKVTEEDVEQVENWRKELPERP